MLFRGIRSAVHALTVDHLITGDMTNMHVSYLCGTCVADKMHPSCVRLVCVLYSTHTIISLFDFPGRTVGILQLKTCSE